MEVEGTEEKSGALDSSELEGLRKEKAQLALKCENLDLCFKSSEEKLKSLQVCVTELMERVKNTENLVEEKVAHNNDNLEKRIGDLETKLALGSEMKDFSGNASDIDSDEITKDFKDVFKEKTLERLTALENKLHDMASQVGSPSESNYNQDNSAAEKKAVSVQQRSKEDKSQSVVTYCQYPPNTTGTISVTNEDYMCLAASQFLNDVMIDFFLKYLQFSNTGLVDQDLMGKTHIFNTFFYNRLTTKPSTLKGSKAHPVEDDPNLTDSQKMYERVRKWTKKVDLFEKEYIVVPIHEKAHWFVCIICNPSKVIKKAAGQDITENVDVDSKSCILVFDSLPDGSKSDICNVLRSYLTMEWMARGSGNQAMFTEENMPQFNPKVRGQKNSKDCGIYLLQYVESFFRTPSRNWTDPQNIHSDWFHKEEALKKRGRIAKLIRDMATKQQYEKKSSKKLSFPPLDFQSVESPFKKSKFDLKSAEGPILKEGKENANNPVLETTDRFQEPAVKVKREEVVKSQQDLSSRDPRLARNKMVLLHKKGNQVSVSKCKENQASATQPKENQASENQNQTIANLTKENQASESQVKESGKRVGEDSEDPELDLNLKTKKMKSC